MTTGVTVIVPAYNEEENIERAVQSVVREMRKERVGYEIIVIDDGSHDQTGKKVRELTEKNVRIHLLKNRKNMGFGYSFRKGVKRAKGEYVTGYPGDGDMSPESFGKIVRERENADLIVSYMENPENRSLLRRTVSRMFITTMNLLFRMKLRYYNGYFICPRKMLQNLEIRSDGLTVLAEVIVRLIKSGVSYKQVPFHYVGRTSGQSKAVSWGNVMLTLQTIGVLRREIHGRR